MASKKAPEGTMRVNVYVNKENYAIFKKYSKALKYTFTDLVNDSVVEFNKMIYASIDAGNVDTIIELYSKQLKDAQDQLDALKKD